MKTDTDHYEKRISDLEAQIDGLKTAVRQLMQSMPTDPRRPVQRSSFDSGLDASDPK